jgi:hypothetical protein
MAPRRRRGPRRLFSPRTAAPSDTLCRNAFRPLRGADPRDESFLREVDEAYRQDELARFWARYGRWIAVLVALALLGFGGWILWQGEQQKQRDATAEAFAQALDKLEGGDSVAAVEEFSEIEGRGGTYAMLATLMQGAVATQGGETDRALGAYRAVAENSRAPEPLRTVASFKALRLQFDDLPPADVIARVQPFLEGDSPWGAAAAEMAALAHLKAGSTDQAGPLLLRVAADTRAPVSMRLRAEQMAASLGQDTSRAIRDLERSAVPGESADEDEPAAGAGQ